MRIQRVVYASMRTCANSKIRSRAGVGTFDEITLMSSPYMEQLIRASLTLQYCVQCSCRPRARCIRSSNITSTNLYMNYYVYVGDAQTRTDNGKEEGVCGCCLRRL